MNHIIGHTPLIELPHPDARIFAKLEWYNLTGSAKDRAAMAMLDAAMLPPGGTVIEATSGNTGIALAALSARRGYRCVIVMPEDITRERQALLRLYGAEVVLTPAAFGMEGAVTEAMRLARILPDSYYVNQFQNPNNPLAHFNTTGPELWTDTGGKADIFVAGVGTGGTVTGVGRYLKSRNPGVKIYAVLPEAGGIPGIGAGFVPEILDVRILEETIFVPASEAKAAARRLAVEHGLCAGISSGAALRAAELLASREENRGKTITTLFPDSAQRYLSTGIYD